MGNIRNKYYAEVLVEGKKGITVSTPTIGCTGTSDSGFYMQACIRKNYDTMLPFAELVK